jgi:mono/diheme cytochrome c family protein
MHRFGLLASFAFALVTPSLLALTPDQIARLPAPAARSVDFAQDIKPILEASCLQCHGRGRDKGGFNLDDRTNLLMGGDWGDAVQPGSSAESHLIALVAGFDQERVMPQKGTRLTADQISLLRAWIDQGAVWDPAITFARPPPDNLEAVRPELTGGKPDDHPVDRLLAPYFAEHRFRAPRVVGDRVFARRVWLDLIGLLPPPAELNAFLDDDRPDKRRLLVRRLLADHGNYATHWLTFWNDLLRNDYQGTGFIDGGRKGITPWLYASLESNKPYHQFVRELVNPTPESEGFTKGVVWRGTVNASMVPAMQASQNVSQVFMGVNLKCASCHDSFIDDWSLADAYGLAGVYSDDVLELVECDKPTGETAAPRFIYPTLGTIDATATRPERIARLAEIVTGRQNGRLTRTLVNRFWQRFLGHGLVEPIDEMDKSAWSPEVLDWLAEDFADHGYDVKHLIETIMTSRAYQLPSQPETERSQGPSIFRGPTVRRMSAEQFTDALSTVSGVWNAKPSTRVVDNHWAGRNFSPIRAALVPASPLQVALGRPNRDQVVTLRGSIATTLEALELTNGAELSRRLGEGAALQVAAGDPSPAALLERLYRTALGRKPTAAEARIALPLLAPPLQPAAVEDLLWALVMLPEFQLIP